MKCFKKLFIQMSVAFFLIGFFASVPAENLAPGADRLGPDVSDTWAQVDLGVYVQRAEISGNAPAGGIAGMVSLWYQGLHPVELGLEGLVSTDLGIGGFVSGRFDVFDYGSILAGVGAMNYNVDTRYGDYYAQYIPTLMLGASYRMDVGEISLRLLSSASSKSFNVTDYQQVCRRGTDDEDHHFQCNAVGSVSSVDTDSTRQVVMVGLNVPL